MSRIPGLHAIMSALVIENDETAWVEGVLRAFRQFELAGTAFVPESTATQIK
jgi:hypothetical protein